jgi:hypothetical protein
MNRSIQRAVRISVTTAMLVALVVMTAGLASAAKPMPRVTYNSVPNNLPGNMPSVGFAATSTTEFGDSVTLDAGPRNADSVTVVMSSWACESGTWFNGDCSTTKGATFSHAITLNLYEVLPSGEPDVPDGLLVTKTQTFAIPFRPSADPVRCTGGAWYNKADKTCYSGFATKITFNLDGTTLPDDVIWTVAYTPTNDGSDSLNVGVKTFSGQPSKGFDVDNTGVVMNSTWAGAYCDEGLGGTGTLRLDSGCWTGYTPLATIRTR